MKKKKKTDPVDYDGMGDFSRYNKAFNNGKSPLNKIKSWLKDLVKAESKD